jgi:phosphoserine phosphatase
MIKTAIFDFDSTLINAESLELLLAPQLANHPEKQALIAEITRQGMEGTISFAESLQRRLAIATPTQANIDRLAKRMMNYLTPGMAELIADLQQRGVDIWIISGGLRELILPVGLALNIPATQIHGVQLRFGTQGQFVRMDEQDPFSHSKVDGARLLAQQWHKPSVMIGDGMTDYQVYQAGLVDRFIAFTQHARRNSVLSQSGVVEAQSVNQLSALLNPVT